MMLESDKKIIQFGKEIVPYIVIIVIVVLIRSFIITPVKVDGLSMYNTLDDGEILLLKKYDKSYERFDVVVFSEGSNRLIKRVIGLPGDKIKYKNNKLYINGKYVKESFLKNNQETYDFNIKDIGYDEVPEDCYFVLGDNRENSKDSRVLGPIDKEKIQGSVDLAIFPFNKIGKF